MKKRTNQVHVLLLLVSVILCITACDALLAPSKGRENPLDPDNPVPIVADFHFSELTETSITLSWTPQADTSGSYPNLMIIYNTTAEPQNINDGTQLADFELGSEVTSTIAEDLDPYSSRYYISAWTHAEVDGEEQYTGPVSVSTPKLVSESVSVDVDGYVDDMPSSYFGDVDLLAGTAARQNAALIRFITNPEPRTYLSATLTIYCVIAPAVTDDIELRNIIQSWDHTSIMYTTTINPAFSESIAGGIRTINPSYTGNVVFDVTSVLNNLSAGSIHRGFLLNGPGSSVYDFASSENPSDPGPKLDLVYYPLDE